MPRVDGRRWGLVYKLGHDSTFYAAEKVKDYNWNSQI